MTWVTYDSSGVGRKAWPMINAVSSPKADAAFSVDAASRRTAQALAKTPTPSQRTAQRGIDPPILVNDRASVLLLTLPEGVSRPRHLKPKRGQPFRVASISKPVRSVRVSLPAPADDRAALVTGASSGIGEAIAL